LAALLGGNLQVQSQLGTGSIFLVCLPINYQQQLETAVEPAPPAETEVHGLPILVVEDQPAMMMMYRSYFKNSGFQLIPAASIREARDCFERTRPAAVILDVVLRSEDSWRLLVQLKQNADTMDIPVMIVSTIEDQAKAFHLGADEYLLKPVERAPLLQRLRDLLDRASAQHVLIIDDDERDRYLLKQLFRKFPLIVQESSGGLEGIQDAIKGQPSAIFLDLTMPDVNGFEVLDALKNEATTRDIPVVICTSRVLTEAERVKLSGKAAVILGKDRLGTMEISEILRQLVSRPGIPARTAS
jgi:CheY-like chemotaxis protein